MRQKRIVTPPPLLKFLEIISIYKYIIDLPENFGRSTGLSATYNNSLSYYNRSRECSKIWPANKTNLCLSYWSNWASIFRIWWWKYCGKTARLLVHVALKLQNQERRFVEASDDNLAETVTNSFQIAQLTTIIKVENIDENVVANQKDHFQFLSLLLTEAKSKSEIVSYKMISLLI